MISSTGLTVGGVTYAEKESGITYDKNGNIKTLSRSGIAVDNLTYTYTTTPGNRLKTVNDASGSNTGFRTGALGDYAYDANGNMTYDINRQATLSYNYLNLPMKAVIGSKQYVYDYDAGGTKHKYGSVNDTVTVKYAGRFEYDGSNVLKRILTTEGQVQQVKVLPSPASDSLRFDYYLKDHLGNVRIVFDERGNVIQKSDYYPFGLAVSRDGTLPENARNNTNRYLYNGKELQVGTGVLDYGARSYDTSIGRMTTIDRFTEKYASVSGYQYALNNPIINIDMNGDSAWKITNQWDASFVKQFTRELTSYIQKYEAGNDKCTCDDLGLSVIMDFAKDNQLPFQWETESRNFDAASNEYSDFSTFSHGVKATSGAPDFQNGDNTVSLNPKNANTGSILLNVKESTGRAHHVQMIMGRSNDGNTLLIKQGNFTSFLPAQRIWGTGDPSSMRYLGTLIQTGTYNMKTDTWRNISRATTSNNFSQQERLIYRAFNFNNWNK